MARHNNIIILQKITHLPWSHVLRLSCVSFLSDSRDWFSKKSSRCFWLIWSYCFLAEDLMLIRLCDEFKKLSSWLCVFCIPPISGFCLSTQLLSSDIMLCSLFCGIYPMSSPVTNHLFVR